MKLADVFDELRVPQSNGLWSCSGRNELDNTVVLQLEPEGLRSPTRAEREAGIAKVHDFAYKSYEVAWQFMRDDLAFAMERGSYVRVILFNEEELRWDLLPHLGRVVQFDAESRLGKIVFFD